MVRLGEPHAYSRSTIGLLKVNHRLLKFNHSHTQVQPQAYSRSTIDLLKVNHRPTQSTTLAP